MLHSSVRVAHEDEKRDNPNGTKKKRCRDGFLRNASRRWQRPLSEVENISGCSDRVQCPTRRAARGRKASAATVTEMSRKMEAVQRRPEARLRLRRLHPEASAPVVREEADTDVEVWRCCLPAAELQAPTGAAPPLQPYQVAPAAAGSHRVLIGASSAVRPRLEASPE